MKIHGVNKSLDRIAFIAICGFFYIATYFSQGNYFDSFIANFFEKEHKREVSTIAELRVSGRPFSEGRQASAP